MPADVSQLEELAVFLRDARRRILTEERRVVAEATNRIEQAAKSNAPVATGALRDSITGSVRGLKGRVDAPIRYATFVEFGTSRMSPQPFMTPALEQGEGDFISSTEEATQRALEG